jgi:hypothetical protein
LSLSLSLWQTPTTLENTSDGRKSTKAMGLHNRKVTMRTCMAVAGQMFYFNTCASTLQPWFCRGFFFIGSKPLFSGLFFLESGE